jgi:hypothetical protein
MTECCGCARPNFSVSPVADFFCRASHCRRVPVTIKCPTCLGPAVVITAGRVRMHFDADGDLCTFTRTASSPGGKPISDEERRARKDAQALVKARVRLRNEAADAARKAEQQARRAAKEARARANAAVCPVCGSGVQWVGADLTAHQKPTSGRWCKGGKDPTGAERARARKSRSVWTVSGGLPSLGKRG